MCGIVLVGGNALGSRDVNLFEQMLYCDIVRGDHSTGVFAGFRDYTTKEPILKLRKAAVPGDVFIRTPSLWGEVKEHRKQSAVTKNSYTVMTPKFMVGHNRYATAGAVIDANAHPFHHGKITLVHNGTLTDQSLLPESNRFKVDSENIAYSIDKLGIEETIKRLNGAYTLVWLNTELQTLNILRNDERPFHLAETTVGEYFGASEEAMLMWLLTRKKTGNPTLKRHFECEVGVQYVFDVSEGFKFKEEVKHELPTFRSQYSGRSSAWYDNDVDGYWDEYYRNSRQHNSTGTSGSGSETSVGSGSMSSAMSDKNRELNKMLADHGIAVLVGEKLKFDSFAFDPYLKNTERGKLSGYCGMSEYIEVQCHGFETDKYVKDSEYEGVITSCFEQNYVLTIIVSKGKLVDDYASGTTVTVSDMVERMTQMSSDTPVDNGLTQDELNEQYEDDEDDNEVEITKNGIVYSKKEWESNDSLNTCANCGSPVPFEDVPDSVVDRDYCFCEVCASHLGMTSKVGVIPKTGSTEGSSVADIPQRFSCTCCAEDYPIDMESKKEGFCIKCYDHFYGNVIALPKPSEVTVVENDRKKIRNGMIVTPKQWQQINTCGFCQEPIQWTDAKDVEFIGAQPCCLKCEQKLEMGIVPQPTRKKK